MRWVHRVGPAEVTPTAGIVTVEAVGTTACCVAVRAVAMVSAAQVVHKFAGSCAPYQTVVEEVGTQAVRCMAVRSVAVVSAARLAHRSVLSSAPIQTAPEAEVSEEKDMQPSLGAQTRHGDGGQSEAAKRSTSPLRGKFLKIGNRPETGSR
mmetsp:Transcript_22868/g.73882  ORF Transcript_22868/g.73882 Transcript_22868/m.73882 type:complete len:151 (+) Transcript_22868:535-987(+)